ncbi:efflux RND transporter periplasmic adaptor subunit [Brevibacillus ruminantium]|uniref:Efflux RND transporter periplasmic adaptor subunit n=1 Tax=Brevibacillus ruminantium TaxID=2950604 RepID=A0ABY4W8J0_9BACL|nr:efflux RND transporter periplasmic adaptor subunit [Brevibacillus ruminantium]USG63337.1 efflux RND transporter periplasmic adaptor subunit [Brevibacillus ruminantium]
MNVKKQPIILALATLLLVAGCSQPDAAPPEQQQQEEAATPVELDVVKKGVITSESGITAKLAPSEEVQISPKISGKITSLPVKLGQSVKAGQVLFKLDEQDLANTVAQQEAAYKVAAASLKQSGSSTDQGLVQAENSLKQAEQALNDAKLNQQRMKQLFDQGAISLQQLEQANTSLTTAQTSYENAKQTLASSQEKTSLQVSEASVNQAAVALQNAREQLANAVVTSPISGFVSSVNGAVGQLAGPQSPVVVIVNTNPLVVKANLSETDITTVNVGTSVKVTIPILSKEVEAKVTAVSPVMNQQLKAYPIEITIPNPANELKADMVVNVTFDGKTAEAEQHLIVPRKAVFDRDAKHFVYRVEGDTAKLVEVTTGDETSDVIVITSGLSEGDQIVVKGQTLLQDGKKVSVINK